MLGVRLNAEDEALLEQHALSVGSTKSALVRGWIKERLEQGSIEAEMRRAAEIIAAHEGAAGFATEAGRTDSFLQLLDELDGGYDWGPEGPPA